MKYQDIKLRVVGRLILLGFGLTALVIAGLIERDHIEPMLGRHYVSWIAELAFMSPLTLLVAIWQLLLSPMQDAKFMEWSEKNLGQKPSSKFDMALDPADPNYAVPTFRYLMAKRRGGIP